MNRLEWKPKKRDHETVRASFALPFSLVQTFFCARRRPPTGTASRRRTFNRTSGSADAARAAPIKRRALIRY
ncbi:MAG: hypothetical protein IJO46_06980, partial [Thermoguttaceae bacterium]|nr:hypothetical protein [Thermoguttaceae bacterium]